MITRELTLMNLVQLIGRIVRDCELRILPKDGKSVCNFTVAVQKDFKGKDGKRGVDFIEVVCWGRSAEFVVDRCGDKGLRIAIVGNLSQTTWQDKESGKNRSKLIVNANKIYPIDWAGNQQQESQEEGYSMDSDNYRDDDVPF